MRTGNILFLSTWLSVSTAALTPARGLPLEANDGHQLDPRVPEGLQILEDEIVTVTEYDFSKCQPTTFITATAPATTAGIYLNTSSYSVTPVSQYSGEAYLSSGISSEAPSGVTKVLIPATAATYSNSPPTDLPSNCQNGPNSRNCWNNCTVDTNYEQTWPVTNTTVEVWSSRFGGNRSDTFTVLAYDSKCYSFSRWVYKTGLGIQWDHSWPVDHRK